ncbi:L,D-transpeptidase family protein [Clostridium ganghwense]|uniref:L,D-transpeptidase family protein n=1 Tax=Clostridium ganghwense TaxID=312089 RepID=A0ABT4CMV5_9CLOT|nr:L,D-transpeptidase family protein [Clostridium ganghwense]MCY6369329.1 L,D-transpeptidase family protein [Clostridium ganghwense]
MKIKKLAVTLCLIIVFSFTACTTTSTPQEKIIKDTNHENIIKKDNDKKTINKNDLNIKEKTTENLKTKTLEKQHAKVKNKESNILKIGTKEESVKTLQKNLNKFGYNLSIDGIFGERTQNAVYDFQNRNKISSDGIVGKKTLTKLNLTPTKETMYNPKENIHKPTINSSNYAEKFINSRKANSPTQYYIWVNTKSPRVYIFEGFNGNWKLIKNMLCTVGKPSTPTIKGTFHVGSKGGSFIVRDNPKLMCKYYTQISGNYLFHTVLLYRNGSIANGTLGAKLSHGCIRLSIPNAKYIYSNIPKGTTIYIN